MNEYMLSSRKKESKNGAAFTIFMDNYKCCLRFYLILVKTTFNSFQNTKRNELFVGLTYLQSVTMILLFNRVNSFQLLSGYKNGLKHNNH